MEVPQSLHPPLRGAKEGLDASSTRATVPIKQRDLHLPPLLKIPQPTISKQRDHRLLPRLQIPRQCDRYPIQLLNPQQHDSLPPASLITHLTRYRQSSGEVYESARPPISRSKNTRVSALSISDPNFLQLIHSAETSGESTSRGDQSPISSDSSSSAIRERAPRTYVFDSRANQLVLVNQLTLAWTTNAMIQYLMDERTGPPVEAAKNGLYTTFQETFSEDQNALKPGQKISDQKLWHDGFDAMIFIISAHVEARICKRVGCFLPYRLRGTQKAFQEYSTDNAAFLRRKNAWREVCNALHQNSASERLTKEFEQVATDFFSGRPVEAEYEAGNALFSAEPKPYHLEFCTGIRSKVLQEDPLANKALALFLEDLVMANEMEQAYLAKGTYQNGLRVYRHESHKETFTALQQAPKYQSIQKIFNMTTGKEGTLEKAMGINEALKVVGLSGGKVTLIDFRDGLGLFTPTNSNDSAAEPRNTSLTGISTSSDDSTITVVTVEEVEAPNTPGDISTSKSVSPGQTSIVEGGSTDLSEISTNIPGSPAPAGILSVHAASANRFVAPNPKVSETGSNSNSPSKISKVPDRAGADSQKASHNDKGNVAAVETANSTSKAESTSGKKKKKKKKNGSKRKAGKKGKGDKKIEELSSSPVNQDSDGATVPQKQPSETRPTVPQKQPSETRPTLSTEVHREAHIHPDKNTPIEDGLEDIVISEADDGWNEVKTKIGHKSKSSKKHASHTAAPSDQAETTSLREFRPEEYPAVSSKTAAVNPAEGQSSTALPTVGHAATLPAVQNPSWEVIVKNLPPEEAEARRVLSRESQHSATPSGTRLTANEDASRVDDNATRAEQHPIQESIAADERSGEKVDEAPESQSTGLEWAAAELTSPTKFNSGWRHSSLLYRCTSPSQDDFDDSVEISTTRRRSTSTTSILHPRVRALQFGDFPVALPESVEEQSAAHSGHSSSPARSVPNTAPTHHGYGLHSSSDLAITGSSQSPAGFPQQLAMPFAAQMPVSQPYFPPPPFMPQLYPPYGFFPAGPGYHIGQPNPHGIPYGPPAPGFAFPPMHPFHSGHIANHAHPIPGAHGYPPNTNTGLGMRSYNQQPFQQASQQDGNRGESSTGGDRSDESFETSSSIDQQPTQSTSGQGADAPAAYRCSYCLEGAIPSKQQPLFFCPGCGPPCAIRYCGAGCLLADSWGHSFRCMQYPYYQRMDPHNMPDDLYEWDRWYLSPVESRTELETRERFRQRNFSMYAWHGPFPGVLKSWAKKNELPVGLTGFDVSERFKKTGDYHIFRSEVAANGKNFPTCEVICTIRLRDGDPMKEALNRTLNACLIKLRPQVVNFLFRLLRHLIVDLDTWSFMNPVLDQRTIHAEFIHQFSREFSFDAQAHATELDTFDLEEEWKLIRLIMEDMEMEFQVLRCWFRTKRQFIPAPLEPRDAYMN